jgi:hypothetical protein
MRLAISVGARPPSTTSLDKNQGNYDKVEPLHRLALAIREVFGPDHPSAASLHNLMELYKNQGKHIEAEPLYQ